MIKVELAPDNDDVIKVCLTVVSNESLFNWSWSQLIKVSQSCDVISGFETCFV